MPSRSVQSPDRFFVKSSRTTGRRAHGSAQRSRTSRPSADNARGAGGKTVRASVNAVAARLPAARCVPWYGANRAAVLRDPAFPVIDGRYREDWVGLSDLWLAAMAVGVTR